MRHSWLTHFEAFRLNQPVTVTLSHSMIVTGIFYVKIRASKYSTAAEPYVAQCKTRRNYHRLGA